MKKNIWFSVGVMLLSGLSILAGCTDSDHAKKRLEAAGYKNIQMAGYGLFGCSEDDFYHDKFYATGPAGINVSGVVCSGFLFKGGTIRLD